MIHKIEKLTSIGKYRNYQATGDVAFKKLTLLFGDNGSGKTTLTAVFRSLTQNNPELIKRRISTNNTTAQAAQIIQRTSTGDIHHTFNHANGWSIPLEEIEIFDIHFINDNIYSGFDFNDEHKKQLHEFVIGAQGITVKQQIEQNKIDKATSKQTQDSISQQIIQQVGNGLTIDKMISFLKLNISQSNNIDKKIASAETDLMNANSNAVIQTLKPLSQVTKINTSIDFSVLSTDVMTTSQSIQDSTLEALFSNHCNELSENSIVGPENWLKSGYEYIQSKLVNTSSENPVNLSCPFCKQPVGSNLDIINAYTMKFNDHFNSLVTRIQEHLKKIKGFSLSAELQLINNTKQMNDSHIVSWAAHLPSSVNAPVLNFVPDERTLISLYQSLIDLVEQKLQNPSVAIDVANVSTFKTSLELLNANIDTYNQYISNYNVAIKSFKSKILSVEDAQTEVLSQKRIKMRFEVSIAPLCDKLITEKSNLRKLNTNYTQLVQHQEAMATTFFTNYNKSINHFLKTVFNTPFEIVDIKHVAPQGRATQSKIGYILTIDGQDISFDPNQPNSVKDCLSEGDKSTIALAFFLAKLKNDPRLNQKIIVFDDPLSSFDRNRRMYTVQIIKELFPDIKQLIVLSHNENFLYEISKSFSGGEKKTLRMTENFIANSSKIEPLDLETLVENEYFTHVKELELFLQKPDISKKEIVLGWLRNVLEAHLRFKFYRQLNGLQPNDKTFGKLITELVKQKVVFRDNANRIDIIVKLNILNGISCKPHHGEPNLDYSTLGVNPKTITVKELANFVNDTLELIDNKL